MKQKEETGESTGSTVADVLVEDRHLALTACQGFNGADSAGLIMDLEVIKSESKVCSEDLKKAQIFLKEDVVSPLAKIREILDTVTYIRNKTSKVVKHSMKLLRLAEFIPKFGKYAKLAIKRVRRADKVFTKIEQELRKVNDALKKSIKALNQTASALGNSSKVMMTTSDVAGNSAGLVKQAKSCTKATDFL